MSRKCKYCGSRNVNLRVYADPITSFSSTRIKGLRKKSVYVCNECGYETKKRNIGISSIGDFITWIIESFISFGKGIITLLILIIIICFIFSKFNM